MAISSKSTLRFARGRFNILEGLGALLGLMKNGMKGIWLEVPLMFFVYSQWSHWLDAWSFSASYLNMKISSP